MLLWLAVLLGWCLLAGGGVAMLAELGQRTGRPSHLGVRSRSSRARRWERAARWAVLAWVLILLWIFLDTLLAAVAG